MEERGERERARVLRKFHTRLCYALQGADPTVIARKLLEKDVISEELYAELEDVPARVDQSTKLMSSLRCTVIYDDEAFEAFLDVLDSSTLACKNLSRKLQQQLDRRRGEVVRCVQGVFTFNDRSYCIWGEGAVLLGYWNSTSQVWEL